MPRSRCQGCGFVQFKDGFAQQQWTKQNKRRFCKTCVKKFVDQGTPFECTTCCIWKRKEAFDQRWHQAASINTRVCEDCIEKRACTECKEPKPKVDFTESEWVRAGWASSRQGRCTECMKKNRETKPCSKCTKVTGQKYCFRRNFATKQWRLGDAVRMCIRCSKPPARIGWWKCVQCKGEKERIDFSKWLDTRRVKVKDRTSRCNECFDKQQEEQRAMSQSTASSFVKLNRL